MPTTTETPNVLETERLTLRKLSCDDAAFILNLVNQPSFLRYIGDKNVHNNDDAIRYLTTGPLASYNQFGFGLYLVTVKETGKPAGMCGLLKRDSLPDADIGFAFLPEYWSQGLAYESAAAVLHYGWQTCALKRILAITSPDNDPSIRLLERLEFKFEGMTTLAPDQSEVRLFGLNAPDSDNTN
ncbi:MAG TPA: GNAT family N-acetyltransferase [Pyrinomonadaceae bacterium]|nr:GNAT family N-acetyltransferase [Pyrinomonadaceae bacterium]